MNYFEQAAQLWPEDRNIASNLRRAREQLQAQREEAQRRAGMQAGLNRMAGILSEMQPVVTSGLSFDGGPSAPASGAGAGGLDFMPAAPSPQVASAPERSACGVNTDASVVDLCGVSDRAVVDPAKLKAPAAAPHAPQPPDPSMAAVQREMDRLYDELLAKTINDFATAKEVERQYDALYKKAVIEFATRHKWPGPANPGPKMINPISDPERYEAWKTSIDARLKVHVNNGRSDAVIERMRRDPGINAARDRIVKKQDEAERQAVARGFTDMQTALEKLRKEANLKDFTEFQKKEQNDPGFKARVDALRDDIVRRMESNAQAARRAAVQEMTREVETWQSAQGAR